MGIWGKVFAVTIISVILLSSGIVGLSEDAFANKKGKKNTTKIIHLGYLQLAAHDFFNMQRCMDENRELIPGCEGQDLENGKLDLSTVLFLPKSGDCDFEKSLNLEDDCKLYDDFAARGVPSIANGGELRSVENIMISTASDEVGEKYLQLVEKHGEEKAYEKVLKFYHKQLKKAYEESFHLKFPKPQDGPVTNLHNLAVRTGHDFLPAKIVFNGDSTSLFLIDPLGEKLSKKEQKQPSSPVDGVFDFEFTGIEFCPIDPVFCISVDLLAADRDFGFEFADISQNLGPDTFDDFMLELEDGKFDKKDQVSILLDEAFSRGINLD
ncbi:MAG: hypothetical exported protein [Marine Group I thaumarchaeote]|nr:MAG: hypothetical exported protein [Marine Group I thaumarchaeote]